METICADSLEWLIDSIATARRAAEVTLFGEESQLIVDPAPRDVLLGVEDSGFVEGLIDNPTYTLMAIAFFVLYLVWLPHIIRDGGVRWSAIKHHRYGEGTRELVGKQSMGVALATWSLGIALFSMFALRVTAQFIEHESLGDGAWWVLWSVMAVVFTALYEWVVLKCVGHLILDMEFIRKLLTIKWQLLFFSIISLSPLFVASSLSNYVQGEWVVQLSGFMVVALVLNFISQSFLLFMRQNFSILHWILYLCGVEILPLTFIWAIASRYLEGAG